MHWTLRHKIDCNWPLKASEWKPEWYSSYRDPVFAAPAPNDTALTHHPDLIGEQPAIDVLNLEGNEGTYIQQPKRLLFAGQ